MLAFTPLPGHLGNVAFSLSRTAEMRIIQNIPKMKLRDILQLWINAITILADDRKSKKHVDAQRVVDAIRKEWVRRQRLPIDPSEYFKWPSTEAIGGDGSIDARGWLPEGVLKCLGYKVGTHEGLSRNLRQRILDEIFDGPIPPMFPFEYLYEWGAPGTAQRLRKMAETIAALTRNAKRRRSAEMATAIDHWEQDLEYLYYEYYVEKFHFAWPSTELI